MWPGVQFACEPRAQFQVPAQNQGGFQDEFSGIGVLRFPPIMLDPTIRQPIKQPLEAIFFPNYSIPIEDLHVIGAWPKIELACFGVGQPFLAGVKHFHYSSFYGFDLAENGFPRFNGFAFCFGLQGLFAGRRQAIIAMS